MNLFKRKATDSLPDGQTPTMGELIARQFHGQQLRIVRVQGQPYFVAKDVCDILDIKNSRDTLAKCLEGDEKGVENIDTLGGTQKMAVVTESGLYSLIFRSTKRSAREFRKWVTAEVLPAIRQTGGYAEAPGSALVAQMLEGQRELLGHIGRMAEGVASLAERVAKLEQRPAGKMLPMLNASEEHPDMFDMVRAIYVRMLQAGVDRMDLSFSELALLCIDRTIFQHYLTLDRQRKPTPRSRALMGYALKNQFDNRLVKCDGELLHTCIVGRGRARRYSVIRMDQDDYP